MDNVDYVMRRGRGSDDQLARKGANLRDRHLDYDLDHDLGMVGF